MELGKLVTSHFSSDLPRENLLFIAFSKCGKSTDFISGLPKSEGKEVIMVVVVDRFTKYSHFIPLAQPFSAPSPGILLKY